MAVKLSYPSVLVEMLFTSYRQVKSDLIVEIQVSMVKLRRHDGKACSLCHLPHSAVSSLATWPYVLSH